MSAHSNGWCNASLLLVVLNDAIETWQHDNAKEREREQTNNNVYIAVWQRTTFSPKPFYFRNSLEQLFLSFRLLLYPLLVATVFRSIKIVWHHAQLQASNLCSIRTRRTKKIQSLFFRDIYTNARLRLVYYLCAWRTAHIHILCVWVTVEEHRFFSL